MEAKDERGDSAVTNSAIQLPTQIWQHIVQLGVERHIQEVEEQLEEAQQRIAQFEGRFGLSLARLQEVGLADDADLQAHEAYVEWSSWEGYREELQERLEKLRAMLESAGAERL
jgi:hypothetical protein